LLVYPATPDSSCSAVTGNKNYKSTGYKLAMKSQLLAMTSLRNRKSGVRYRMVLFSWNSLVIH